MSFVQELKNKILNDGYEINREEAIQLLDADLDELTAAANEIRPASPPGFFCGNKERP